MPTFIRTMREGLQKYMSYHSSLNSNQVYFSVKHKTTYFPPKKRGGVKECARRIKQGLAGTCYVHGHQYI